MVADNLGPLAHFVLLSQLTKCRASCEVCLPSLGRLTGLCCQLLNLDI